MSKIKYILLGLLISTSASAQEPQIPDLPSDPMLEGATGGEAPPELPDFSDPLAAPTNPAKDKVLDNAIDEVFKEPEKPADTAKTPEPKKEETLKIEPAEAPAIDESAAPIPDLQITDEPVIELKAEDVKPIEEIKPVEEAKPVEVTPENPVAQEKKEESKPAETKPVEIKKTEPEKAEPKKTVKPVAKAKPVKKVNFPKQTPKSLKSGYSDKFNAPAGSSSDQPLNLPTPASMETAPAQEPDIIRLPEPATPVAPSRELPDSLRQGQLQENELDLIQEFPSRSKPLKIKSDIVIDKATFNTPFSSGFTGEPADETLAEIDDSSLIEDGAPVVDFSQTDNELPPLPESDGQQTSAPAGGFYLQDSGLEVSVKSAPKNYNTAIANAHAALKVGQYESAIRYYEEVLAEDPANKKAQFGLATAYHSSKQYEKAKKAYLDIIKTDPDYWPAVNNYIVLVTEENPGRSIQTLEELYAKNPDFAAIPAQLGNLYFRKGNSQKSVDYYVDAVKLDPSNLEYKYNLAIILEKSKQYPEAAQLYKSLLDAAAKGKSLPENPNIIRDRYFAILSK